MRGGFDQPAFRFAAVFRIIERDDERALGAAAKAERRRVLDRVLCIAQEKFVRVPQHDWTKVAGFRQPFVQPLLTRLERQAFSQPIAAE